MQMAKHSRGEDKTETEIVTSARNNEKEKKEKKAGKTNHKSVRTSVAVNMQLCCLFLAIKMPNKEKRPKAKII